MARKLGDKLKASLAADKDPLAGRFERLDQAETQPQSPAPAHNSASPLLNELELAEHMYIPLELVDDNPYNARTIYLEHIVIERAASIASNGQSSAVSVIRLPSGRYQLIDGHYRKRALQHLGRKEILARIVTANTPLDQYKLSFASNDHRSGQTPLDNAIAWKKLLDNGICKTEDDIAQITMVHKSWVNKILSLVTLPDVLLDIIAEHPDKISQSVAYEIVLFYKKSEQNDALTEKLLRSVVADGLGKRDVESERKRLEQKTRRTHVMSRQFKITKMTGVTGSIKDWGNGRVVLDVKIEDGEKRKKLLELLKSEMEIQE